ncbi:MAG: hypothetical protein JWR88_1807, partial [Pseudonocardia sp.]|nr:hypothetical protein [Pseudonocardia sp.]
MRLRGPAVRWRSLLVLLAAVLVWLLAGCSGPAAPAALPLPAPAGSALELDIAVPRADFGPGDEIPLMFTVTNRGTAACELAATDVGTVALSAVTRGGETVVPTVSVVRFFNGADEAVRSARRTVEPGGRASFPVTAVVGRDGPGVPLSVITPLASGEALAANVRMDADGDYVVSAAYRPSGQAAAPCTAASNVASVAFRVGSSSWLRWGLPALIALAVVLAAFVLFLVLRRRRASAAGAVLLVLATCAALMIAAPQRADAATKVLPAAGDPTFAPAFSVCMDRFTAPGGDPAGLLPIINGPNAPVITVRKAIDINHQHYTSDDHAVNAVIWWSPSGSIEVDPKTPTEPAVLSEPCEALYHELSHASRDILDTDDDSLCGKSGVKVEEVSAVIDENLYRTSRTPRMPPRKSYHGKTVPTSLSNCFPPPEPPDKGNPRIGPCHGLDGQSCADSNGDPHLLTFDRYRYDFQAVGELVAAKAAAGDLEMQLRQSAYPGSKRVSVNTAVATRVGALRLGFYLDAAGTIVVHRDGQVVDLPTGDTALPGGGRLTRERVEDFD